MNHDEPDFEKKFRKYSVAAACPRCQELTFAFRNNRMNCTNCGYEESIPTTR